MSYRARKIACAALLMVGLPLYIVVAATLVGLIDRPGPLTELAIYVGLGILWALPLRSLFRGIARPDPANPAAGRRPPQP
jgi:hypothetical protein